MFNSAFSVAGDAGGGTAAVGVATATGAGAAGGGTAAAGADSLVSTSAGMITGALAGSSTANGFLYSLFEVMTSRELGL